MKYKVQPSTRFTKDLKLCKSRGWDTEIIKKVIKKLSNGMPLEEKYKDHSLSGNWNGYRECHIQPDWLLIYRYTEDEPILYLTRTGSHSDLFQEVDCLNKAKEILTMDKEKENNRSKKNRDDSELTVAFIFLCNSI